MTKRSGGSCYIHRRYLCPKFHRQSFHEYAKASLLASRWAGRLLSATTHQGQSASDGGAGAGLQVAAGHLPLWQSRIPYQEEIYEAALRKNGSPLVSLFDRMELGKSPFKNPVNKLKKSVDGLPQR